MKKGLLLLNLGTPAGPDPESVGAYLKEFLMDPLVIDIPWLARWFLIHVLIVPKRKYASSEQYKMIWTERGSPLLFHLEDLATKVAEGLRSTHLVRIAMRYGGPSVQKALHSFAESGVSEITVLPLYPQYAESSTRSSIEECLRHARQLKPGLDLKFIPAFYEHPAFIKAYAAILQDTLNREKPDHVLLSYHSLPERHIRRTDRSGGSHCLKSENCCAEIVDANRDCYRAQCFATSRALAAACGLKASDYTVSFQSRLGRAEWIKPPTEETIHSLAGKGIKRLAVACPSFTADCLETIEEIGVRAAEVFHQAGGERLIRVPCLNAEDVWVNGLIAMLTTERG